MIQEPNIKFSRVLSRYCWKYSDKRIHTLLLKRLTLDRFNNLSLLSMFNCQANQGTNQAVLMNVIS